MGIIVCRALTKVGKEIWPHGDHEDDECEMPVCRADLGIGIIICGTLTEVGKELGHTRTEDDAQRERSSWSAIEQ